MQCNFRNYIIRWKMLKSTNVSHTFLRQLLPFQRYKNFKFFTFKSRSRSQSHEVQFSRLRHSMENVKIFKWFPHIFALALIVSEIYFLIFTSKKQVKFTEYNFLNYTIRWQISNLQMSVKHFFCARSYRFRDITKKNFTFKKQVKVTECNFRNHTIRQQMSKSTNVSFYILYFR